MQKKIIIIILLTVVVISVSLGVISSIAIRESIDYTLQHKLELVGVVAKNIDSHLGSNINRLYDVSLSGTIDLTDGNWTEERDALRKAYNYSVFSDGLFLVDKAGNIVYNYPPQPLKQISFLNIAHLHNVINEGRPYVSDIYTMELTHKKMIYILVPLKNRNGDIVGAVGGEIDPSAQGFNEIIKSFPSEKNTYMELIDSLGFVIASSDSKRMFKDLSEGHSQFLSKLITAKQPVITKCHRCHELNYTVPKSPSHERSVDIMAYAPLQAAPWGVSILLPEKEVLAPVAHMKRDFTLVSIFFIGLAFISALGMSRGIVKPVHELIRATRKIAEGDMSKAVAVSGRDEMEKLGTSFEMMRVKLAASLDDLQKSNAELEAKVVERTRQISDSRKKIKDLLNRVISSQEAERKRIAREFHDVIMQDLAASLIKIDLCRKYPESITVQKMDEIKMIIEKNIDEVYLIIKNLRPSVIDDLGFEAAVRWLLDHHLESKGVHCYVSSGNEITDLKLDSHEQIELFRIIQEAIINIARHSRAENVFVIMELNNQNLNIEIEDDGSGFSPDEVLGSSDSMRGLGLMGMKERAAFMNWQLKICSGPGEGTRVGLKVPLSDRIYENV